MFLLALTFYLHLVSTTSIDSEMSDDGVILLPAIESQREVFLVDPTLLFGTNEQNRNGPRSDATGPSDTSTEKVRQNFVNETGADLKYWINDNPLSDLSSHVKQAKLQLKNETVHLSDPKSTRKLRRIQGKESSEPWFNNKPSPSLVAFLKELTAQPFDIDKLPPSKPKTLSRRGLENEISERWSRSNSGSLDPFIFLKRFQKAVSENATTHLPNSRLTTPKRVDRIEILDPLRWLNNNSGSSNLLTSLKRSKRQVNNETEDVAELSRWPGMPQDILREAYTKTRHVKKKLLTMMLQSLYSAQERLWPLANIVNKYNRLAPYRMAFIFMKLDQLVNEGHSIFMYLKRQSLNQAMTMTRRLQLYSQIMRRNIDVTYLVDYIMERVPRDQVVRIRQWVIRHEQEELMRKKQIWDKTYGTKIAGRPPK